MLEICGDNVRIGIGAPRDVSVHPKEIYARVRAANEAAAGNTAPTQTCCRSLLLS